MAKSSDCPYNQQFYPKKGRSLFVRNTSTNLRGILTQNRTILIHFRFCWPCITV